LHNSGVSSPENEQSLNLNRIVKMYGPYNPENVKKRKLGTNLDATKTWK
jgi:hypothetical protein